MGKNCYAKECSEGCGALCYYGSTVCPDCYLEISYENYLASQGESK